MRSYRMTNYNERYTCSVCHASGVKLWRDYNTFANHIALKCAECATPAQIATEAGYKKPEEVQVLGALDDDLVFTFRNGDQLGGLVPAVTTSEGDTFWGYTSVPGDRLRWWHEMPTYDDEARELRCLRNLWRRHSENTWIFDQISPLREEIKRSIIRLGDRRPSGIRIDGDWESPVMLPVDLDSISDLRLHLLCFLAEQAEAFEEYKRLKQIQENLTWLLERKIYEICHEACPPIEIWVQAVEPTSDPSIVLRYAKEQSQALTVGDQIAIHKHRAVLILGDAYAECPSIASFDGDAERLEAHLIGGGYAHRVHDDRR